MMMLSFTTPRIRNVFDQTSLDESNETYLTRFVTRRTLTPFKRDTVSSQVRHTILTSLRRSSCALIYLRTTSTSTQIS